jgi:hypothetical protein
MPKEYIFQMYLQTKHVNLLGSTVLVGKRLELKKSLSAEQSVFKKANVANKDAAKASFCITQENVPINVCKEMCSEECLYI